MNHDRSEIIAFVVHWNQPDQCIETVRRLREQHSGLKIVVIDNASKPDLYDRLRAGLDPEIQFFRLNENKGWGPALNVALTQWLTSPIENYCLISAHDADPAADCVRLLLNGMESDERLGIVCPQYPDATVAGFSCLRGVYQDQGIPQGQGTSQLVEVAHGTLMLVRRECLQEIGLFDERYFAYGDEHELGLRARRRGWKIAMIWGATVANRGTWTPSPLRSYLFTRNSLLLVHDYCGMPWAWTRAALILLNTLRLMIFSPNQAFAFSAKARWRGVQDYFASRFSKAGLTRE